jgi:hypothetical protein
MTKSILVLVLGLVACRSIDDPCDPDQRYSHGLCYEVDASDPAYAHFGDVCVGTAGCASSTNLCLISAGASAGYCTLSGCVAESTSCPLGWTCNATAVCIAPG